MVDLVKDVCTITTLSPQVIASVLKAARLCIGHAVCEGVASDEEQIEFDTGLGTLTILCTDNGQKYRFVPSKQLSKDVKLGAEDNQSALVNAADDALTRRITNTYKEFL